MADGRSTIPIRNLKTTYMYGEDRFAGCPIF